MDFTKTNRLMVSASPWITIGISFILMVIILFQTVMMYNCEKEHVVSLLKEKGAVFIQSFEAGIKNGMQGNLAALEMFVEKTAAHPDISYVFVADASGKALAHSDRKPIGTPVDDMPVRYRMTETDAPWWRIVDKENARYFEVYKPLFLASSGQARPMIFIGMDVHPFEQAVTDDLHHNIVMITIVFLVGLAGMVSLIWSRRVTRSRRLLQDVRAFAAETIASLPMGVIIVDRHQRIRYMNDPACSLLDTPVSGVTDKRAAAVLPEDLWYLHQTADNPGKGVENHIDLVTKTSGATPVSVMVTRIFGGEGDFIGFLFILKDLRHIRALEAKIRRKERLAALGTLASGIAHEVRNPLSSIKGYAGFFGSLFKAGSDNRKAAQLMVEEIDRVDRVISELLEFARPADLQLRPIQPEPLVNNSLRIIRHEAQSAGIRLREKTEAPLPELYLDPDRFSQVLLNLYINAMQAMPHGGDLTVNVRVKDDTVLFAVSDTGEGILPRDQPAVFNPYYTTKKKGTGLGLAIVHKIVEGHNGTVWLESTPGKGTTFFISITPKNSKGTFHER